MRVCPRGQLDDVEKRGHTGCKRLTQVLYSKNDVRSLHQIHLDLDIFCFPSTSLSGVVIDEKVVIEDCEKTSGSRMTTSLHYSLCTFLHRKRSSNGLYFGEKVCRMGGRSGRGCYRTCAHTLRNQKPIQGSSFSNKKLR